MLYGRLAVILGAGRACACARVSFVRVLVQGQGAAKRLCAREQKRGLGRASRSLLPPSCGCGLGLFGSGAKCVRGDVCRCACSCAVMQVRVCVRVSCIFPRL